MHIFKNPLAPLILLTLALPAWAQGRLEATGNRLIPGQRCVFTWTPGPGQEAVKAWEWRVEGVGPDAGRTKEIGGFTRVRTGTRNLYRARSIDRTLLLSVGVRPVGGGAWTSLQIQVDPPAIRIHGAPGVDLGAVPAGTVADLRAEVPQGGGGELDWSVEEIQGGGFRGPRHGESILYHAPDILEAQTFHIWCGNARNGLTGCASVRVVPRRSAWPPAMRDVLEQHILGNVLGGEWAFPELGFLPRGPGWLDPETPKAALLRPGETWEHARVLYDTGLPSMDNLASEGAPPIGPLRLWTLHGGDHAVTLHGSLFGLPDQPPEGFPHVVCRAMAARPAEGDFVVVLELQDPESYYDWKGKKVTTARRAYLCTLDPEGRVRPLAGRPAFAMKGLKPTLEGPCHQVDLPTGITEVAAGPGGLVYLLHSLAEDGAKDGAGEILRLEGGQVRRVLQGRSWMHRFRPPREPQHGPASAAWVADPWSLTVDPGTGDLYFLDYPDHLAIRRLDRKGRLDTLYYDYLNDPQETEAQGLRGPAWQRPWLIDAPDRKELSTERSSWMCNLRQIAFHAGVLCFTGERGEGLGAFDPATGMVRSLLGPGLPGTVRSVEKGGRHSFQWLLSGPFTYDRPLPCAATDLLPEECAYTEPLSILACGSGLLLLDKDGFSHLDLPGGAAPGTMEGLVRPAESRGDASHAPAAAPAETESKEEARPTFHLACAPTNHRVPENDIAALRAMADAVPDDLEWSLDDSGAGTLRPLGEGALFTAAAGAAGHRVTVRVRSRNQPWLHDSMDLLIVPAEDRHAPSSGPAPAAADPPAASPEE